MKKLDLGQILSIGFFVLTAVYRQWALGLCSALLMSLLILKDMYLEYVNMQKSKLMNETLQKVIDENKAIKEQLDKLQASIGVINFRVSQVGDIVGVGNGQ